MPKTGSSAIQAFLALNQSKLKGLDILYPNPDRFLEGFQTSSGNCYFFHELFAKNKLKKIRSYIDKHFDQTDKNLIFSSEVLFHSLRLYPERFFKVFSHYNFKIICYVRQQELLFSSACKQMIKGRGLTAPELETVEKQFDFFTLLMGTQKFTATENIVVRPYEEGQFYKQNIYDDFCKVIGINRDDSFCMPEKNVNPSLNQSALEYRRLMNIVKIDHDNFKKRISYNNILTCFSVDSASLGTHQGYSCFSLAQRKDIYDRYKTRNDQLAKVFYDNKPLFTEVVSNEKKSDGFRYELAPEEAEKISKYIYRKRKKLLIELYALLAMQKDTCSFPEIKKVLLPAVEVILTKNEKKKALIKGKIRLIQQLIPFKTRTKYHELKHRYSIQYFKIQIQNRF